MRSSPILRTCILNSNGSRREAKRDWRGGSDIRSRKLAAALILAVAAVGVWLIFARWRDAGFEWQRFLGSFRTLHWTWLTAAVLTALATYYGRVIRWAVLLRPLRPHPSHWNLFVATAIGFTAVVLLGRPGEIVRPYLIAKKENVSFSSQMAAWMLERIYDLLIVLLLAGIALVHGPRLTQKAGSLLHIVFATGGKVVVLTSFVCFLVLFLIRQYSETMRNRLLDALRFLEPPRYIHAAAFVNAFVDGVASTKSGGAVLLLTLYTFLEWLLIGACYYCLFQAQPATAQLTIQDVLMFLGFVALGSIVQIPGIGGGMQLVAVLVLTELFGVGLEAATGLAILIWAITFVVIVPFGVILAALEGLSLRKIRSLGKEVQQ